MNEHFANRLMWGIFIIGIGTVLMLRQSGLIEFDIGDIVSLFWPVILLFLGVQSMIRRMATGHGSMFGAAILLLVGFVFLGRNLDLFEWSVSDIGQFALPIVIILFGLRMIMKPKPKEAPKNPSPSDEWQAYPYRANDNVPPAPPLHPDPTKQETPSEEMAQSGPGGINLSKPPLYGDATHADNAKASSWQSHGHESIEARIREKIEKNQRKAERVHEKMRQHAERMHRHHHHGKGKERVEWWNSDPNVQNRSGFIGDIYVGHDYFELKPMNISHFIGDTVLDLTKAQIPFGETRIHISSFIGDVKVFLPNDLETGIHVVSSAFIGDVAVLDQKDGGLFKNMDIETPYFPETEKKIKLVVSTFIGDVRVTKVG
ncbi:cell wall-active antibiotics response protein LiaF [Paenibacillus phyllosphaerae]|nr:cell wall-active antibiotics response protein LiaF [Paenibacillus phyllosphaerae]